MKKFTIFLSLTAALFVLSGVTPNSSQHHLRSSEAAPDETKIRDKPKQKECIRNIQTQQKDIVSGLKDIKNMLNKKAAPRGAANEEIQVKP